MRCTPRHVPDVNGCWPPPACGQRFGVDTVVLHRSGGPFGLDELLEDGEVGDLNDHPDTIGSARVAEGAGRDAVRSESLFPLSDLSQMTTDAR
jgi:hypothetical protein